jgi:DNA-binding transcriptional MocR family regulator
MTVHRPRHIAKKFVGDSRGQFEQTVPMSKAIQVADWVLADGGGTTRVAMVMGVLRARIADRSLGLGARLPSIRSLVASLGVSKSTVVDAYDRLSAEGVIVSRQGSGFYVSSGQRPLAVTKPGPRLEREVDPLWMTRHSLEADATGLRPGCGWLPDEWMPDEALRQSLRQTARDQSANLVSYDVPQGHAALRQVLCRHLKERAIDATPSQIILTNSTTPGIDLACRLLLEPGETVLVDEPSYFNFLAILRMARANVVGVPFTPDGPNLVKFEAALKEYAPRLYLTNATIHNPTGAILSLHVAYRLLKLAEAHDLTIIEDDVFADFEVEPTARLSALDGLNRVIYVGGFSKTLSASLRCGFVAARQELIEPLIEVKLSTESGGGPASADIVYRALTNGFYRRHTSGLKARLGGATGSAIKRLRRAGLTPWMEPRGGMFIWAELPDGLLAADVARAALSEGMLLAPGDAFSVSKTPSKFMRFNASQCADPEIFLALERAMRRSAQSY